MLWVFLYLLLTIIFFCILIAFCAIWTGADADRRAEDFIKRIMQ